MYSFLFNNSSICQISEINFKQAVLWIINNDQKPPHIGFSCNNQYFSLKANGADLGLKTAFIFNFLNNKKTPFILVQLINNYEHKDFLSLFKDFELKKEAQHTCLSPILKIFNLENTGFILPDLLDYLKNEKKIKQFSCVNQKTNQIGIVNYSKKDILKRIYDVRNNHRK